MRRLRDQNPKFQKQCAPEHRGTLSMKTLPLASVVNSSLSPFWTLPIFPDSDLFRISLRPSEIATRNGFISLHPKWTPMDANSGEDLGEGHPDSRSFVFNSRSK